MDEKLELEDVYLIRQNLRLLNDKEKLKELEIL